MALHITCSNCRQELHVPDEFIGKRLRCPSCKNDVRTGPAPAPSQVQPVTSESVQASANLARLEESILGPRRDEPGPLPMPAPRSRPRANRPRSWEQGRESRPKGNGVRVAIFLAVGAFVIVGVVGLIMLSVYEAAEHRRPAPVPFAQKAVPPAVPFIPPQFPQDPNNLFQQFPNLAFQKSETERHEGDRLAREGKVEEAVICFRKALDIDPQNAEAYFSLIRTLRPGDPRSDLAGRFAKLASRYENFETFAKDCRDARDGETLLILAREMHRLDPNYLPAEVYLALALIMTEQPEEALNLFKQIGPRVRVDAKKEEFETSFLKAMAGASQSGRAYEIMTDARGAFRILAHELKLQYLMDELRQLCKAHARKHADDPLLPFFEGDIFISEMKYQQAEKAYVRGMARPPEPHVLQQFRANRVLAKYHTGQVAKAYAEIGPKQETFDQLANLCWQSKKYEELKTLLDEHAKIDPGDNQLLLFRIRLKIKDDQLDEAKALLKTAQDRELNDNARKSLMSSFLYAMVDVGKALEAYEAVPDAQQAFKILAPDLRSLKKRKELLVLLERHRKRHPEDIWLTLYEAQLAFDDKAWDRSINLLDGVWNNATEEFRNVARWTYIQAMYQAGRAVEAYRKIEPRDQTFDQLASQLALEKKGKELNALVMEALRHFGGGKRPASVSFYQVRAWLYLKKTDLALSQFKTACERKDVEQYKRQDFIRNLVVEMEEQEGRGLEAYRLCPDRKQAFRVLAGHLVFKKKEQALESLLQEHAGLQGDVWTLFYEGELHLLRGEKDQAESTFAAALAKAPKVERWTFLNGWLRASIQAGKVLAAYKKLGPSVRNFEDLAFQCVQQKNARQLQDLLTAHRQAMPEAPNLGAWEIEVLWLNKDYKQVLKALDEQQDELSKHRWKFNMYRVRCHIRLKQTDKAIAEAETLMKNNQGSAVMVVLSHAASGDAKQAIAAVERYSQDRYFLEDCYRDEDLGPILRGMPEFCAKYPEPKFPQHFADPDDPD